MGTPQAVKVAKTSRRKLPIRVVGDPGKVACLHVGIAPNALRTDPDILGFNDEEYLPELAHQGRELASEVDQHLVID